MKRVSNELLAIVETSEMYLLAGFDLGYAWRESMQAREKETSMPAPRDGEPFAAFLRRLVVHPDLRSHAPWWHALASLYESGSPLQETLSAFSAHLRGERARDIEGFIRTMPMRLHLRLLLFFVPPTLFLLFLPMLKGLSQAGFPAQ